MLSFACITIGYFALISTLGLPGLLLVAAHILILLVGASALPGKKKK